MATYSKILIGPETSESAYVEILDVEPETGQILVPAPIRKILEFFEMRQKSDVMLELAEQGHVIGHSFEDGKSVYQEIAANYHALAIEGDKEGRGLLMALAERFIKSRVNMYGQMTLHGRVLYHLGREGVPPSKVFIATALNKFELWSPAYRDKIHDLASPILQELSNPLYETKQPGQKTENGKD